MSRRLARLPAGRRTKWLVLVAWLVLLMAGGGLGSRLQSVTQNNSDAYLPGSAEATKVIKLQDKVHKEDSLLTVVSYERRGGITPPKTTRTRSRARRSSRGFPRPARSPDPSLPRTTCALAAMTHAAARPARCAPARGALAGRAAVRRAVRRGDRRAGA